MPVFRKSTARDLMRPALVMPVLAMLMLAGCGDEVAPPAAPPPTVITAATAGAGDAATMLSVTGTVRTRRETPLAFPVAGRLAAVTVDEGDRVGAGRLLARLDSAEVDAGIAAARAEAERASAEAVRMRKLFQQGWVARARLDAAEAAAKSANAAVAARGFAQRYARIEAPTAGVVLARLAEPGQMIAAGTPVLTLGEAAGGFVLRAPVSERQLAGIIVGQNARVSLPGVGPDPVSARVIEIAGRGDVRTGTFELELLLPPLPTLRSGMIGEATLAVRSDARGVVIPAAALWQVRAEEGFVYRIDAGGRVRARRVTLGKVDDDGVEVLAGLAAGERVATSGLDRLSEGARVTLRAAR